jgi:hypothetical protein
MLSLVIMTGFTFLFGPVLATLDIFLNKSVSSELFRSLKRVQVIITEADAFLVLSIQIATIVRQGQNPPIFEISFLKMLNLVLCFLVLVSVLSQVAMNIEKIPRLATILCYGGTTLALMGVSTYSSGFPSEALDVYHNITKECYRWRGYEDVSNWFQSTLYSKKFGKLLRYLGLPTVAIWVSLVIVGLWVRSRRGRNKERGQKNSKYSKWTELGLWHKPMICLAFFLSGILGYGFWKSWTARALLARLSGDLYQDDQWGFGQITAALIPAPIVVTAAHEVHSKLNSYTFYNEERIIDVYAAALFGKSNHKGNEYRELAVRESMRAINPG